MPFRAKVDKHGLVFLSMSAAARWQAWCEENTGKTIRIEEVKPTRSDQQNRLLWVFYDKIEKETGQPAADVHEWAKRRFLTPRFIRVNDQEMKIVGSTRTLDKAGFSDFMDKIAAEIGIAVPNPEEAGYISNYK